MNEPPAFALGRRSKAGTLRLPYIRSTIRFLFLLHCMENRRLIKNQLRGSLSLKRKRSNVPETREPCSSKDLLMAKNRDELEYD